MNRADLYQIHLDRVSRSFAFCIARLDGEMRSWVGLSYLLCRMLDTVEDAIWRSQSEQDSAFDSFRSFVEAAPDAAAVQAWARSFPQGIPEGERLLLEESAIFFQDLHSLSPSVREKIRKPVLNMYRGMRHFLRERREAGELRLRNLEEVNQYCFFVAGLVGELLTDLVALRCPAFARKRTYLDAHHFGLFLQKINLLKDQSSDEKEGRFLVPSRKELLASLSRDAEAAIRYLQTLPVTEKGFRLFCAWSLFLGLASLPWIERSRFLGIFQKIPRLLTQRLLASVEAVIDDNQALLKLFRELLPVFPVVSRSTAPVLSLDWMGNLYQGALGEHDFIELGLVAAR
jgi:phytoene/squalene synthetase